MLRDCVSDDYFDQSKPGENHVILLLEQGKYLWNLSAVSRWWRTDFLLACDVSEDYLP